MDLIYLEKGPRWLKGNFSVSLLHGCMCQVRDLNPNLCLSIVILPMLTGYS